MRWLRRYALWRGFRARHKLDVVVNRTGALTPSDVVCVMTVRDEALRLPYFLDHHRALGVRQFLIVDNDSTDGSRDFLAAQPDVSLWHTQASYKAARFGVDWSMWLLMRYGHGQWCLTLDADELLVYPHMETRSLRELGLYLDQQGAPAMGALMVDLYPKGPINSVELGVGQAPTQVLTHFDSGPYRATRQKPKQNLWVQGGARERVFFFDDPRRGPTLNKLPFVRWNRRYAYVNSTHSMLPPRINHAYDGPGESRLCGALLHTKFLPDVTTKAEEEKRRRQHFRYSERFDDYHDAVIAAPDFYHDGSVAYEDWRQLERLGLISRGAWA